MDCVEGDQPPQAPSPAAPCFGSWFFTSWAQANDDLAVPMDRLVWYASVSFRGAKECPGYTALCIQWPWG